MQTYHAASCTSAVNNSAFGGAPARDTARADSSSLPANFSLNPRLGPPDYYPQTPNCPEEILNREYVQSGYRETVEELEAGKDMGMSTSEVLSKTPPKLVTTNKALKLAEQWVNNMSKSLEDETTEEELEGRPSRLGLGAKVTHQSKVERSSDPVERRLHAKLNYGKRKAAKRTEEAKPSAGDRFNNDENEDEDEDEESESRTSAFAKKKVVRLTSSLQARKKSK